MVLIALVLLSIALANGMEAQAFLGVLDDNEGWGTLLFVIASIVAVIGDLRRMGD